MIAFNNFRNQISRDFISGDWIFRGQSNLNWGLETSYFRFCNQNNIDHSITHFEENLEDFILAGSNLLGVDLMHLKLLKQIALAQHHGLPTPYLDWTFSPYIALFFAVNDFLLTFTNNEKGVRVWAIKVKKNYLMNISTDISSLSDLDFKIIHGNVLNTKRVSRQLGCFTYHDKSGDLFQYKTQYNLDLRYFDIAVDKFHVLSELKLMGINSGVLFNDLNGIAIDAKLNFITRN